MWPFTDLESAGDLAMMARTINWDDFLVHTESENIRKKFLLVPGLNEQVHYKSAECEVCLETRANLEPRK